MTLLNEKKKVKLSNQSLVFEIFGDDEKLTVVEISERVNEKLKTEDPNERLSASTIRRAIDSLVQSNFLRTYGRQNNATLYGKLSAAFSEPDQKLINFGGELLSVEDFLRLTSDPSAKPLQLKFPVVSEQREHDIRRRLAFVIMSAGNLGYNDRLKHVEKELSNLQREFEYIANLLQGFLDGPVWYQQYRDRIGQSVRKVQEKDPDLFQLATEYMKGG